MPVPVLLDSEQPQLVHKGRVFEGALSILNRALSQPVALREEGLHLLERKFANA